MQEHRLSRTGRELYERFLSRKGNEGAEHLPKHANSKCRSNSGNKKEKEKSVKTATPLAESP